MTCGQLFGTHPAKAVTGFGDPVPHVPQPVPGLRIDLVRFSVLRRIPVLHAARFPKGQDEISRSD
jgi:hypothetical protein